MAQRDWIAAEGEGDATVALGFHLMARCRHEVDRADWSRGCFMSIWQKRYDLVPEKRIQGGMSLIG